MFLKLFNCIKYHKKRTGNTQKHCPLPHLDAMKGDTWSSNSATPSDLNTKIANLTRLEKFKQRKWWKPPPHVPQHEILITIFLCIEATLPYLVFTIQTRTQLNRRPTATKVGQVKRKSLEEKLAVFAALSMIRSSRNIIRRRQAHLEDQPCTRLRLLILWWRKWA